MRTHNRNVWGTSPDDESPDGVSPDGVSPDELMPALELALKLEHTRTGLLMLIDHTSGELRPAVGKGLSEEQCDRLDRLRADSGRLSAALETERRFVAPRRGRRRTDAFAGRLAQTLGARRVELFPIRHGGRTLGALALLLRGRHRPTPREARMVESCARMVAIALDVERRRGEADRRGRNAQAAAARRMQLFARSSHELRIPLQSITGYLELLRLGTAGKPTAEQQRMLERIEVSEKLLLAIIEDQITLAQLEAGQIAYELEPVVLTDLVRQVDTIIAPLAQRARVHVAIEPIPPDLVVEADATKLAQILVDLFGSVVRSLRAGGTVRVNAAPDDDHVRIEVRDDGPGIDPDKLHSVCEPFVQLAGGREACDGGLGLTISRELAIGMGADLTAHNEPGCGAVFTLRIERA